MARTPAHMGVGEGGGTLGQIEGLMNGIAADLAQIMARLPRFVALSTAQAAAASTTAVHAAVTDTGVPQTITTAITNPPYPRNITATSGGTATDIKAIQVTVNGTNIDDEVISEVLPIFTVNAATTVLGNKAFKTVTSFVIPAHDGLEATTALGFGDKIGLPDALAANPVLFATLNAVREATLPAMVAHATLVENNTADLSSALNATAVTLCYVGGVAPGERSHLASTE